MIDANIPLQAVGANIQNPIQTAGQLVSLKDAGIDLQNRQQAQQDDADTRAAFAAGVKTDPTTGQPTFDRGATLSTIAKLNPTKAVQMKSAFDQQDAAAAQAKLANAKAQTELSAAQLAHATAINGSLDKILQGVSDQATYTSAIQHAQQMGIDTSQFPPQYDPTIVQRAHQQVLSTQEVLAQKNKEAEMSETGFRDQNTAENDAAERVEAAKRDAQMAKYQQGELGVRYGELNLNKQKFAAGQGDEGSQLTGDALLKTLAPGMQAQVKAMANGDVPLPPAGTRNNQAQALRAAVFAYDPTVTQARYSGKQSFETGKDSTAVVQLGTALKHADNALANSQKVGTAPLLGFNATPADAAYNKDVQYLTGEVGKLVTGGALTVDEGHKLTSGLDSTRQSIRDASIKESLDLLGGKTSALFQKYKTATGQDLPTDKFFDADTQSRLQKYGIAAPSASSGGSGSTSVTAPNGKTYNFPDAASASAFKAKAGIQ
jgi:hypothetical protein